MPRRWSGAFALAMLGFYIAVLPRVPGEGDAAELELVLATGGVAHPTGYPIYTMLGHGFCVLVHALGASWTSAANSWAAVGGATALFFYHRVALRFLCPESRLGRVMRMTLALVPALLLGFNPVWSLQSTVVEVYSWHLAWILGTSLYFFRLMAGLEEVARTDRRWLMRNMAAWGFLCGLGGAHHATSVFFVTGLSAALIVSLARTKRLRLWMPLLWLGAALLPLSSYGYIYFRATQPTLVRWPLLEPNWHSVWGHLTGREYRSYFGHWSPSKAGTDLLNRYIHPFLWPGLALLAYSWRAARGISRRTAFGALLGTALLVAAFSFRYGVDDPSPYFLPCLAVGLLGLLPAAERVLEKSLRFRHGAAAAAVATGLALVVMFVPWVRVALERRREYVGSTALLRSLWQSIPFERGIVLWPNDMYYLLREYQIFRNEKPSLDIVSTVILCNPRPAAEFRRKYGFDPLAYIDAVHLAAQLKPDYVIGGGNDFERHYYALVHEAIADSARVPVLAFEPEKASFRVFRRKNAP